MVADPGPSTGASSGSNAPSGSSPFPGFDAFAADQAELRASLVARRRHLGLSQTQVAARMGTSQSAVARFESGIGNVRLSTLERYAAAVGHRLGWLVGAAPGLPAEAGAADAAGTPSRPPPSPDRGAPP